MSDLKMQIAEKQKELFELINQQEDVSPRDFTSVAHAAIGEAEVIAEATGEEFSFDLAYGMGGTFGQGWDASSDSEWEWQASSESC